MKKIQDLLDEVSASGVGLYELKSFGIVIKDPKGRELEIDTIKVAEDSKEIRIKVK